MEVYKEGIHYYIRNSHGPVPKNLRGMWTSQEFAEKAVAMYQASVRASAVNVTQKARERKERYAANNATPTP